MKEVIASLLGETIINLAFRVLISSNGMMKKIDQSVWESVSSKLAHIGESEFKKWFENFKYKFNTIMQKTIEDLRLDTDEATHIVAEMEMLFQNLNEQPLSIDVFSSEEKLFNELKRRYSSLNNLASDREMADFCSVLRSIVPLLLEEKKNENGYALELMQECLKNILQIQEGTEALIQQFDEMWKIWRQEKEKKELPEQKFYRLWSQSLITKDMDTQALTYHQELLIFLQEEIKNNTFDQLCIRLPNCGEGIEHPLPEYMCTGNAKMLPLFYAEILIRLAEAYEKQAKKKIERKLEDYRILECLKKAQEIMEAQMNYNAICQDESEKCNDFCETLSLRINTLKKQRKEHISVASINVNHENHSSIVFEPVFSGCFDSASGNDQSKLTDVELNLFQLAACGKTILLQGPQIVDNRNILQLLCTTNLRMLCKMGIVVFSAYGQMKSTRDFIINCLNNPNFKFSSVPEYNNSIKGTELRRVITKGLNASLPFENIKEELSVEVRQKMEPVYDAYRIAAECFCEEYTMKYHQNPQLRSTNFKISRQSDNMLRLGLADVLHEKLEDLIQDQRVFPVNKRDTLLQQFKELEQLAQSPNKNGNVCQSRSDYEYMITDLRKKDVFPEETLNLFQNLIHTCYYLYNGKLSCDKVIIPMTEPMICVYREKKAQESIFKVDYQYKRYKLPSAARQNIIGWDNIAAYILAARQIMANPTIPLEKKASMMHKETGLVYEADLEQSVNVTKMSAKTSDGKQTDVLNCIPNKNSMYEEKTDIQEYY